MALIVVVCLTILWTRLGWFGMMPVGGDATRFGLGLMSELSRSFESNRIPYWNSLWGYGFPALAESQMGVFYPPHFLLYKFLSLESAYAFDMAVHAVWAAVGAYLLARGLGRSQAASALAAISFVTSGFFLVHEPHHWGWTTGAWMPWIFRAGIMLYQSGSSGLGVRVRRMIVLSACIAMPVLTGHFQLGFISLVSVSILVGVLFLFSIRDQTFSGSRVLPFLITAPLLALFLTVAQVMSTWELAQQADQQRDWEYLSGFALPPSHLFGLVTPALGRTVTFWRPLIWDQFHTSPEELFFYVGLVPLWLSCVAIRRKTRVDRMTQAIVITLVMVLMLASGPYLPGFSWLIKLPGFSFFRAPVRWTLAATMLLCLLAAQGLDEIVADSSAAGKSLRRFSLACLSLILLTVVSLEVVIQLSSTRSGSESAVLSVVNKVRAAVLPDWSDVRTVQSWVTASRVAPESNAPQYAKPFTELDLVSFNRDRLRAYSVELGPPVGLLSIMLVGSFFVRSKRLMVCLMTITMSLDLWLLSGLRAIELAPMKDVASQSAVLAKLKEIAVGHDWPPAVSGDTGNLPMSVGASPIKAYRTLDIPVMPELASGLAQPFDPRAMSLARLAGVGVFVFDPPVWAQIRGRWNPPDCQIIEIDDPTLWSWLTTSEIASRGPTTFGVVVLNPSVSRVWTVSKADCIDRIGEFPPAQLGGLNQLDRLVRLEEIAGVVKPASYTRPTPERLLIDLRSDGPEFIIVAQWAAPDWQARIHDKKTGVSNSLEIKSLDGGWQGLVVPDSGDFQVELLYRPKNFRTAQAISGVLWLVCGMLWVFSFFSKSFSRNKMQSDSTNLANS